MKSLKHYFGQSRGKRKGDDEEDTPQVDVAEPIVKKRKKKKDFEKIEEQDEPWANGEDVKPQKRRRKKRKLKPSEQIDEESLIVDVDTKSKGNSDSSKENLEEPSLLDTSANNSLLNYFGKTTLEELQEAERQREFNAKKTIKVAVEIHYPIDDRPPLIKKKRLRLRKRTADAPVPEYDIITSEEDLTLVNKDPNLNDSIIAPVGSFDCSTPFSNDDSVVVCEDEVVFVSTEPKDTLKVKHDGTLASFFKIGDSQPTKIIEKKSCFKPATNDGKTTNWNKFKTADGGTPAPFPCVSHVQQKDAMKLVWNLSALNGIHSRLLLPTAERSLTRFQLPEWSSITEVVPPSQPPSDPCVHLNVKEGLKLLKKDAKTRGVPVSDWLKELKALKKNSDPQQSWTDKYVPQSGSHVIGNTKNVQRLKAWLTELKNSSLTGEDTGDPDDTEFISFEDSSSGYRSTLKNAALISGPLGSGKTSSVYALAQEIGYTVLEVNASSSRSGKKILHEYSEALQSHKVERSKLNFNDNKKIQEGPKHSLLLVEDVDLVFSDHDDGFLNAISALAATSKRPIIFLSTDPKSKVLNKITPLLHLNLEFEAVDVPTLSTWLRAVSLAEESDLRDDEAKSLINWSGADIRKSLLQLQFICEGVSQLKRPPLDLPERRRHSWRKSWSKFGSLQMNDKKDLKRLKTACDLLAVADLVSSTTSNEESIDTLCGRYCDVTVKESTLLTAPESVVDSRLSSDFIDHSLSLLNSIGSEELQICENDRSLAAVSLKLEESLVSRGAVLSRSSLFTDYFSCLRDICRSEKHRLEFSSKRNSRVFHYLSMISSHSTADLTVAESERLCEVFSREHESNGEPLEKMNDC